ncbi:MAG: 4,5-dihydroxyphthalate decarboxylase [Pseudomonadota bacterium]|jgi:4,5-dihydroxyphthalate decarboxylase
MTTTLAIDRYDRLIPFYDGTVEVPAGLDLKVLQIGQEAKLRDGQGRHSRMLNKAEFDAAEVSLSSYVAATARGMPLTAIPVFPRRLFSLGQIFVNTNSGIRSPKDLEGRKVGLQSFQTTLAVLAKGDVAHEYGVDLRKIDWFIRNPDTVEAKLAEGFRVQPLPEGSSLVSALGSGKIDAIFYSRTPWTDPDPVLPIRRMFDDPEAEEARFYKANGYWPIMHVVAIRNSSVEANPELPKQLMQAFASAHKIVHQYINDPGWSRLAWTKYTREREALGMGPNLWPLGVAKNRANLERFIGYSYDQGIIDRRLAVEDLFHSSVHGT